MNLIIPKDATVDYFVMDLRDSLNGSIMNYDNGKNSLPELVLIAPKKYLVKDENGEFNIKIMAKFFKDQIKFKEFISDIEFLKTKFFNFYYSIKEYGIKEIYLPKNLKTLKVGAKLGNCGVQYINVDIMNPIKEIGETEKFINVRNGEDYFVKELIRTPDNEERKKGLEDKIKEYNYRKRMLQKMQMYRNGDDGMTY